MSFHKRMQAMVFDLGGWPYVTTYNNVVAHRVAWSRMCLETVARRLQAKRIIYARLFVPCSRALYSHGRRGVILAIKKQDVRMTSNNLPRHYLPADRHPQKIINRHLALPL